MNMYVQDIDTLAGNLPMTHSAYNTGVVMAVGKVSRCASVSGAAPIRLPAGQSVFIRCLAGPSYE